jgi:hypothetical protein
MPIMTLHYPNTTPYPAFVDTNERTRERLLVGSDFGQFAVEFVRFDCLVKLKRDNKFNPAEFPKAAHASLGGRQCFHLAHQVFGPSSLHYFSPNRTSTPQRNTHE